MFPGFGDDPVSGPPSGDDADGGGWRLPEWGDDPDVGGARSVFGAGGAAAVSPVGPAGAVPDPSRGQGFAPAPPTSWGQGAAPIVAGPSPGAVATWERTAGADSGSLDEIYLDEPDGPVGLVALVAAAALAVAAFLPWARGSGTVTGEAIGLTDANGWGVLVPAIVVAFGTAMLWTGRRARWVGSTIVVAALVALGSATFTIVDIAAQSGDLPGELAGQGVDATVAADASIVPAPGVWVAVGAAALAAGTGFAALVRRP